MEQSLEYGVSNMKKWLNGEEVEMEFEESGKQNNRMNTPLPKELQIEELKRLLTETDYICNKIVEGDATVEHYSDLIEKRKQWRREIKRLEK